MKIRVRQKQGVAILDLEGSMNINASNFIETIGSILVAKSKLILCNFANVRLVDYVGISVLAVAYKNVLNHDGNMKIYNLPRHVARLFTIVGLDRVFDNYSNEDEALRSFIRESDISRIMSKQLRRRFKRIPSRADIQFRPKFSPRNDFYRGKVVNLSADGVFIISSRVFPVGEILLSKIYLLPKPGIIEVDSRVIWVADQEIQPLESPAMGLEFYNIASQKQRQIVEFVEKNRAAETDNR